MLLSEFVILLITCGVKLLELLITANLLHRTNRRGSLRSVICFTEQNIKDDNPKQSRNR